MKKLLPIVVISVVVLSGLGASGLPAGGNNLAAALKQPVTTTATLRFTDPILIEKDSGDYLVAIAGATSMLSDRNKPELPLAMSTVQIPYGSRNIQVTCTPTEVRSMSLDKDIAPTQIVRVDQTPSTPVKDPEVYGSSSLYPSAWYSTNLGAGRNEHMIEVVFVSVACYPVRYAPAAHHLDYATGFDITITYEPPQSTPKKTADTYNMVIIGPEKFNATLRPLVTHKNSMGVKTFFKSVESIESQYNGTDPPEQLKLFIKDAYDTYNISYVLLAGGLKSYINDKDKDAISYGSKAWWVPVRYVSIPEESGEGGCICDLYYGCLYNATGAFDSWDSNHDGVYAAWGLSGYPIDHFDLYPEVFYGRLAATTKMEMKNVVNKIIKYETSSPKSQSWFNNVIGVAGKTFTYYQGKPDGEWLTDQAIENLSLVMPNINPIRCYSTNRDTGGLTPTPKDIIKEMSLGASFVDFEGHGNPMSWNCVWFDGNYPHNWTGGIHLYQFWQIKNGDKLPMVIVGGCHNGMFNVSLIPTLKDTSGASYYTYGIPIPCCFSWGLISKSNGGAIGSTGCTGYGLGGENDPNTLSAALENNFFYVIGHNNATTLGQAIGGAVRKYINENSIGKDDAYVITDWQFFGDPSLLIGGY